MSGRTRVLLTPQAAGASPGSPVAAVEVFDARGVRAGGAVLYAGTTSEVLLPGGQDFLVRGWTPSGRLLQSTFTTGSGGTGHVSVGAVPGPEETGPPAAPPQPEQSEQRMRTPSWQPTRYLDDWEPGLVEWATSPPRGREWAVDPRPTCVLLPGANDGASRGWWVPHLSAVELVPVHRDGDARTTHVVRLRPGLARTLLGYLRSGNLRAAAVIADAYMSWYGSPGAPGASPTADLAVGYYLQLHRRPEAAHWIRDLNRAQRGSPDASILYQSSPYVRGPLTSDRYAFSLFNVLTLGPPAVAAGLSLLLSYVRRARRAYTWGEGHGFDMDGVVRDLTHCLRESRGSLLTSFTTSTTVDGHTVLDQEGFTGPASEPEPPHEPHTAVRLFPARVFRRPLDLRLKGGLIPPTSMPLRSPRQGGVRVAEKRTVYRLPVLGRGVSGAADEPGGDSERTWERSGVRCVLRALPGSRVDIVLVASDARVPEGVLARFTVDTGAGRRDYFMALVPSPATAHIGELRMDVTGDEVHAWLAADLELWDRLCAEDAEVVARSVAASRGQARELWRRLAGNAGPELAAAVAAGLGSPEG